MIQLQLDHHQHQHLLLRPPSTSSDPSRKCGRVRAVTQMRSGLFMASSSSSCSSSSGGAMHEAARRRRPRRRRGKPPEGLIAEYRGAPGGRRHRRRRAAEDEGEAAESSNGATRARVRLPRREIHGSASLRLSRCLSRASRVRGSAASCRFSRARLGCFSSPGDGHGGRRGAPSEPGWRR